MIITKCPASCGELIQGYIDKSEKLISYPINCYSYVKLFEGKRHIKNNEKAYKIIENVFEYYGYKKEESDLLVLDIKSEIPRGKGMASSTADLAATALAVANYLGKKITEKEIALLCTQIEPTDSTLFQNITLFDHIGGTFIKNYGNLPTFKVLLLEGSHMIDTVEFRKINRAHILKENEGDLKKALNHFEKGIIDKNLSEIGKAATVSALANQKIIHKKGLEDLIDTSIKFGGYGVNVAHSGSVIGIIYNDYRFDKEKFLYQIKEKKYMGNYIRINEYENIMGGAKVL